MQSVSHVQSAGGFLMWLLEATSLKDCVVDCVDELLSWGATNPARSQDEDYYVGPWVDEQELPPPSIVIPYHRELG